eukprot:jgi/Hompol1/4101/HPOL_006924-RA
MIYEIDSYSAMGGGLTALTKRASLLKTPAPSVEPLREYPGVPPAVQSILTPEDRAASGIDLQTGNVFLQSTPLSVAASSASSGSSAWSASSASPGTTSTTQTMTVFESSIRNPLLAIVMLSMNLHDLLLDEADSYSEDVSSLAISNLRIRHQQLAMELAEFQLSLPFSLVVLQPEMITPNGTMTKFSRTLTTIILQFHHVRISLHSLQIFRLFEFGLHDALLNDANFICSVESAFTIFECIKITNKLALKHIIASPGFSRSITSAMRILKIAQTIGFMGIDANILEQVYLVFKQSLDRMKLFWVWGQYNIDSLTAEYTGRVPITTETRIML